MPTRFVHTNIIAHDWRKLAAFYQDVFACTPVPPERDLFGSMMEAGTAVVGAHLRGIHLRLPGHGPDGPTLEIFSYQPQLDAIMPQVNRPGFGHIAFLVDDVAAAQAAVVAAGGSIIGEIVTTQAGSRQITWCYVRDIENNIIELQKISDEGPRR
jgi:predicted enzyme related to lactoylglutathione lyase